MSWQNYKHAVQMASIVMLTVLAIFVTVPFSAFGQTSSPLNYVTTIPIPNWTTSGTFAGNFDALWFNPQNGVVYIADRVNDGATAVDTKTWRYLGTSSGPGCGIQTFGSSGRPNCRPSGVLTTADEKLIVTSPGPTSANPNAPPAGIWVFDLRSPQTSPTLIQTLAGPDFVDYDPINNLVLVKTSPAGGNGDTIQALDLSSGSVVGQLAIGASIEQMHWNPVDGLVYVAITDAGKQAMAKVDTKSGQIVGSYPLTANGGCTPHQFQIDPVSDIAVIGCSEAGVSMDLRNGNILSTYAEAVNIDTNGADMSLRHAYLVAHASTTASGCPADSTKGIDVVAVVSGSSNPPGQFVGVACGGRGQKGGVADPLAHNIYIAQTQYPADPNSASTGMSGLAVFHDSSADVTGTPAGTEEASTSATLASAGGSGVSGSVNITLRRRAMFVDGGLSGLTPGSTDTVLVITTTAGNEVVPCGVDGGGKGYCQGRLYGDPLIGGMVDVGSGGNLVASGPITLGATVPTFISTDSFNATE